MLQLFITILATATLVTAGILSNRLDTGRIVKGEGTTIQDHPYQVSLQTKRGFHFCGGSIINEDTVITAAHCMQSPNASEALIRLGSTNYSYGGQLVGIRAYKNHEGYINTTNANDVCVIKLASPVRESDSIRFIALAKETPPTGTKAVVTGWGVRCFLLCLNSPDTLRKAEVELIGREDCASDQYKYGGKIKESMICAGGEKKDSCQGDSGGPLVSNDQLVGIVSWGILCGRNSYPGVYAEVAHLRQWIIDVVDTL